MALIETAEQRVGRPNSPKTLELIDSLRKQIAALESTQKDGDEMRQLAEMIRVITRAMKGLGADDDVFLGLINAKDIRERTRLDETNVIAHSAMRIAGAKWKRLEMFGEIADMEDPYFISEDGEGRKEGILLQQAKTRSDNLILNMPNTRGGVAESEEPHANMPQKQGRFRSMISKVIHR